MEVALRLNTREQVSLKVRPRQERGSGQIGVLRREQGLLPGVIYGHKQAPFAFKTEARELERILKRGGRNAIFLVEHEGQDSEQAIIRDIQYHKVRGHVLHLDLLRIDPSESLRVNVPLITRGVPSGVRISGGALQQTLNEVEMECIVSEMPSSIEIDVAHLEIGDSIHVSDLLEQEPRILTDESVTIVSVLAPRLTVLEEEAAAEGEAVEGEEGEGEEGEGEEGEGEE